MKYQQLDSNKKEELKINIYNLRNQRLSYEKIAEELKKQGIEKTGNKDIYAYC